MIWAWQLENCSTKLNLSHLLHLQPHTGMLQDGSNHYSKMYNYIVGEHSVLYIAFIPKQETGVTSSYILKDMKLLFEKFLNVLYQCVCVCVCVSGTVSVCATVCVWWYMFVYAHSSVCALLEYLLLYCHVSSFLFCLHLELSHCNSNHSTPMALHLFTPTLSFLYRSA